MSALKRPYLNRAFAVGLLVALTGASFLVAYTFFRKGGLSDRDSYPVHAYLTDATGITWKSRVQIAGIQIGEVSRVSLEGTRARLWLRIRKDIDLRADACLTKKFPSALLPDAEIEMSPGTAAAPSLRDLPPDQREITCVREAATVTKLLDSLSKITSDIQMITGDLTKTVAGSRGSVREIIENLASVSRNLERTVSENGDKLSAILGNAEAFTRELREVAEGDRERYRAIARNVERASEQLNQVLESVQGVLGTAQPRGKEAAQAKESVEGLKQALDKMNRSLGHVEEMTQKVAEGKGIAGKLLADEQLGERLGTAVEGISDYVNRLARMQVAFNIRSEWLLNESGSKGYFDFLIMPRPDKYYLFEIVSDPRGVNTVTNQTVTTVNPATGQQLTTVSTSNVNQQQLVFSAEFAKRYGPLALRVGVIESSGGVGADLYLLDDRLSLSLNLYQFTRPFQNIFPRAKLWANYSFINHVYVTVGSDDFLNSWRAGRYPGGPQFSLGRDVFFGGGLFFTDDDIKVLLGAIGGAPVGTVATTGR